VSARSVCEEVCATCAPTALKWWRKWLNLADDEPSSEMITEDERPAFRSSLTNSPRSLRDKPV